MLPAQLVKAAGFDCFDGFAHRFDCRNHDVVIFARRASVGLSISMYTVHTLTQMSEFLFAQFRFSVGFSLTVVPRGS